MVTTGLCRAGPCRAVPCTLNIEDTADTAAHGPGASAPSAWRGGIPAHCAVRPGPLDIILISDSPIPPILVTDDWASKTS